MAEDSRRLPVIQPGAMDGAPPLFDKIAIVGLGLIGGSIALAARQVWPKGLVIGHTAPTRSGCEIARAESVEVALERAPKLAAHLTGRLVGAQLSESALYDREVGLPCGAFLRRTHAALSHRLGLCPGGRGV